MTADPTTDSAHIARGLIQEWDSRAWCLAALALWMDPRTGADQRDAARQVLGAVGLSGITNSDAWMPRRDGAGLGGQARAPLMQIAALLSDPAGGWAQMPADALIAQGRASAQSAPMFSQLMLPQLDGLAARLSRPGARMLDVGVGVAAQAIAFAEVFPELTVVGIDVLPRVLELAAAGRAASAVADRVVLREQDVSTLTDDARYDLAFVPAPFLPTAAVSAGVPSVVRALKPGGWICIGHGRFHGSPLEDSLTRLKTSAYGGTVLDDDDDDAQALCTGAGLVDVRTVPTPPGAPAVTVGRRPSGHAD